MAIPRPKGKSLQEEMKLLTQYLTSTSSEKAKQPLLYPFFRNLYDDKFIVETDAQGADGYVEGVFILETKSDFSEWLAGFYQALHYQKRFGLAYQLILVIAHKFVGIWRVNQIPEHAFLMAHTAAPYKAPSLVGRENAARTPTPAKKEIEETALYFIDPKRFDKIHQKNEAISFDFNGNPRFGIEFFWHEIASILRNSKAGRMQIDTHNFIGEIELLKDFFDHPIEAVHAFYTMIAYWDITSAIAENEYTGNVQLVGFKSRNLCEPIAVKPAQHKAFKKFVENRYIFTNEGSGLTVDYYFSRFDEVMSRIDPEYVKQHGIFFTDANLSRFALWFAKRILGEKVNDLYIFFDPAGGSGNLISSWRGKQKHKIISELQPDLLRIIERRMKIDPYHVETGFTIIPKTSENKGLNFLDCDAATYVSELEKELKLKNLSLDKPIAFLLNPPYKNTDEHESARESADANYTIHPSILELTGEDAGKERYLAFLGQILNIARNQTQKREGCEPVVMIFTPTSWLIPRPTYVPFRKIWDSNFSYLDGFIITSNEFFKLKGKWPLAFTVWKYQPEENRDNRVSVYDLTKMTSARFSPVNWAMSDDDVNFQLGVDFEKETKIQLSENRISIKGTTNQKMYDFKRDPTQTELKSHQVFGGLPLNDSRRKNKKTYGISDSSFIGFMDDCTPVRIKQDSANRLSNKPDRFWFYLDNRIIKVNLLKCFTSSPDKYGYCVYDLESAKNLTTWFSVGKAIAGRYPTWANQSDLWAPEIKEELAGYWYSLCFAFVLAENRCVVTTFEADNPVPGAPEIFVDNPLCPANPESFWATVLDQEVSTEHGIAFELVKKIKQLYRTWNLNYCKGQYLRNVGLKDEPYFRYFGYEDYLTPYSGLIQIKKYAEKEGLKDLHDLFAEIQELTKKVREELYRLLVEEFRYFE
ncbi:MAG TPA: hypothetical protein DCR40_02900 [Prolixibacteraceae bacterium]|nr:hypothetical protein [Prolixibacteraceae bacterium]